MKKYIQLEKNVRKNIRKEKLEKRKKIEGKFV